ncbi:hypothetical protein G7039_21785 [Rhizobium leguminosarum]|nr:hypothetical protein G7039_21785 [Rhizobium leguminosarum]
MANGFYEVFREWAAKGKDARNPNSALLAETWQSLAHQTAVGCRDVGVYFEAEDHPIYVHTDGPPGLMPTWFEPISTDLQNLSYTRPIQLSRQCVEKLLGELRFTDLKVVFPSEQSSLFIPAHIRKITLLKNSERKIHLVVPHVPEQPMPSSVIDKIFGGGIFEAKSFTPAAFVSS